MSARLRWALGSAAGILVASACVADVQLPWMDLVVNGQEVEGGRLVSYCWSSFPATVCADGDLREPPLNVVRTSQPAWVQVRTKTGVRELRVAVTDVHPRDLPREAYKAPAVVDPAHAEPLRLGTGMYYIGVFARWDRGNGYFLFGLRVAPE